MRHRSRDYCHNPRFNDICSQEGSRNS